MKVLLTGAAGFIGMHCAERLLARGDTVVGVDNLNDYYDVALKEARLVRLQKHPGFGFARIDIADRPAMEALFAHEKPQRVIHLAAQAGVRYSLLNPHSYVQSNLVGFINVLEGCRHHHVEHLVYASSSSVYGANRELPFSVHQNVDHPLSLYAATKKANELMAHTYSHLYRLPTTGLRFFTVYGPWGRPDMALFLFTKAILEGRPIDVFNNGRMRRDFTFIDDIADGVIRSMDRVAAPDAAFDPAKPDPATSDAPWRVYNIGNHEPVELLRYIQEIEEALGKKAVKNLLPMQPGDVTETFADIEALKMDIGFAPRTPVREGVRRFVDWYRAFYGVS
ncbi:MAG TPA: NAD-dependent epimerase [Burkholderiales bacterium]|nr:NAD-dependent epimerase [Burkholderiales bacterium]